MTTIAPPPPPLAASFAPQQVDPVRPGHTVHGSGHKMARHIRLGAIALALMGVAAFGIIIVSAYDSTPSPEDVPVVTASGTPLRERPVDEGGMQIANRDSTVFNSLSSGPVDAPIEQLVPPPEQPMDMPAATSVDQSAGTLPTARRPDGSPALTAEEIRALHAQRRQQMMPPGDAATQAMSQLETAANNVPAGVSDGMTSTVISERMEAPAPASETAAAPSIASAPVTSPSMSAEGSAVTDTAAPTSPAQVSASDAPPEVPLGSASAPTLTPETVAPVAAAPAAPVAQPAPRAAQATPVASGNRFVQLGAVRTEDAAKAEWRRLQTKYRAQLGSLTPSIERADLGARGVYWRIRGGSVSADSGKSICDALKAAGQSCMVVGR